MQSYEKKGMLINFPISHISQNTEDADYEIFSYT